MLNNYTKLSNGVIKQEIILNKPQVYDIKYVEERYDSYGNLSKNMSYLRLGFLLGQIKGKINSILDVGYGNGDFLEAASNTINSCYGNDVTNYPLPSKCTHIDDIYSQFFDVVCFFDVLEHFEDIYQIKNLKCNYIYISLPWCHYHSDEWFNKWKHRRPDEHFWHFNDESLNKFMNEIGYKKISSCNIEDVIRKPIDKDANILTCIFKKTKEN